MCAGAIINSRLRRVVYGAADPKAGCCGSVTDLFALPFNHRPAVERGLRAAEASALLEAFFVRLRAERGKRPKWRKPSRALRAGGCERGEKIFVPLFSFSHKRCIIYTGILPKAPAFLSENAAGPAIPAGKVQAAGRRGRQGI